jgi:hypothetical protein
MEATEKEWIDAIGGRVRDLLVGQLDNSDCDLVIAALQVGLLYEPKLLESFRSGNGIIGSDHFENFDDPKSYPKYIEGKNNTWRMKISMLKKPNLKKRS